MSGVSCVDQTPSFEKTWGSSASSGYCSEEDSDSELEQYFTARTSFFHKPQKQKVSSIKPALSTRAVEVLFHFLLRLFPSHCRKVALDTSRNITGNISLWLSPLTGTLLLTSAHSCLRVHYSRVVLFTMLKITLKGFRLITVSVFFFRLNDKRLRFSCPLESVLLFTDGLQPVCLVCSVCFVFI